MRWRLPRAPRILALLRSLLALPTRRGELVAGELLTRDRPPPCMSMYATSGAAPSSTLFGGRSWLGTWSTVSKSGRSCASRRQPRPPPRLPYRFPSSRPHRSQPAPRPRERRRSRCCPRRNPWRCERRRTPGCRRSRRRRRRPSKAASRWKCRYPPKAGQRSPGQRPGCWRFEPTRYPVFTSVWIPLPGTVPAATAAP